jgi:catechol 2,3-dioxygenase-like lactoylglutathione lyase family enzyme
VKNCPIQSISEVAFWTHDLDHAISFYQKLGFTLEDRDEGKNAFLRAGDFLLVLFNPDNPGTKLAEEYLKTKKQPVGQIYHVAFKVEPQELDRYCERLQSDGLQVKGPIEFQTGRRSWFIEDPDEHYIEITDR